MGKLYISGARVVTIVHRLVIQSRTRDGAGDIDALHVIGTKRRPLPHRLGRTPLRTQRDEQLNTLVRHKAEAGLDIKPFGLFPTT